MLIALHSPSAQMKTAIETSLDMDIDLIFEEILSSDVKNTTHSENQRSFYHMLMDLRYNVVD